MDNKSFVLVAISLLFFMEFLYHGSVGVNPDKPTFRSSSILSTVQSSSILVGHTYPCSVFHVVDGDTFDVRLKALVTMQGKTEHGITFSARARHLDMDSPERYTEAGKKATAEAKRILLTASNLSFVYSGKNDSFGRMLGSIYGDFGCYSTYMISNGFATVYED